MRPLEILETCLYVDDLDAAERFYGEVLLLSRYSRAEDRHVFFRCGARMMLLFDPARTRDADGKVPPHGATGAGHAAFAIPLAELEAWRAHLAAHQIPVERDVTWPGGGRSLYIRDPAGNSVELATPAVWHIEEREILRE